MSHSFKQKVSALRNRVERDGPTPKKMVVDRDVLRRLAVFYEDRKVLTVIECSSCGWTGAPEEEEELANGHLSDKCPECKDVGFMCSYTAVQWRRKQRKRGVTVPT